MIKTIIRLPGDIPTRARQLARILDRPFSPGADSHP
jgi:hypothetical protein